MSLCCLPSQSNEVMSVSSPRSSGRLAVLPSLLDGSHNGWTWMFPGSPEANGKLPVSRSNLLAGRIRGQTAFAVEATMTRERLEVGCNVGVVVPCPDGHVMTGLALPMVSAGNKLPPTCSICNALAAQVEHSLVLLPLNMEPAAAPPDQTISTSTDDMAY